MRGRGGNTDKHASLNMKLVVQAFDHHSCSCHVEHEDVLDDSATCWWKNKGVAIATNEGIGAFVCPDAS